MDEIQHLAIETIEKGKQALIFTPSRASAEKTAEEIAKLVHNSLPELEQEILGMVSSPTRQCKRLSGCIRKGIAFHHAGLVQKQKERIEEKFREGEIKIICATPTLAAGLSMPAYRVIIKSLKRYSGRWGMDWIPVLEYMQMAGRAGRPEYESIGEAITVAKNDVEKNEIYEKYVCGEPEDIYSKLAVEPVLRTYLLSLIASGIIRDYNSMQEFFGRTFWAHQFNDMRKLEQIMARMVSLLEEWEFIIVSGDQNNDTDFQSAATINEPKEMRMRATVLGRRVSELYLDPLTARHLLNCLQNYSSEKNVFSLLQMISNTLEMRPLLRVKAKEETKIQEALVASYDQLLHEEPSAFDLEYNEFMNSIKTTLFFNSWIDEKTEDFMLEEYDIRPGEIRYKTEAADWLLYASEELAKIVEYKDAVRELRKLRIRVKNGVKEELLHLLKLKGIGRIRARKLYSHSIKNLGDVKNADLTTLSQLVGKAVAIDIKKQVGQETKEVPKGTRKGQLSINKF